MGNVFIIRSATKAAQIRYVQTNLGGNPPVRQHPARMGASRQHRIRLDARRFSVRHFLIAGRKTAR